MHITITQLRPQVARALKPAINDPSVQLAVEKTFLAKASDERLDRLGKKVQDFALKRVGLAPAALTFFPQAAALIPPGQEVAFRKTLVDLEHVAAIRKLPRSKNC
jgi:hypothetical protein